MPKRLVKYTERTITSLAALEAELEQVRTTGLGYDVKEHSERICAVATLVKDAMGGLAALTIAVPSERFYGREDEEDPGEHADPRPGRHAGYGRGDEGAVRVPDPARIDGQP
jgi:DNA-binding IclR family transcriptional regulator